MAISSQQALEYTLLPEEVRVWLGSETVTYRIMRINERLKLPVERRNAIALLVHRIAIRDLAPGAFASELKRQLNLQGGEAQSLGGEIFEQVFQPIERTLRSELNIEVADMVSGGADEPGGLTTPVVASEVAKPEPKRVDFGVSEPAAQPELSKFRNVESAPKPVTPAPPREPEPEISDQPFLIHEEKPDIFAPRPSPDRGFFRERSARMQPPPPPKERPVSVRIETPEKPKRPVSRVVHYSNLRTPLEETDAKNAK